MTQASAVHLVDQELFNHFWCQAWHDDRIGDAGADLLVDGQGQRLHELRLANEHEVVRSREVLEKEAQTAQALGGHEMSVVDDGDEQFVGSMDLEGFLDQEAFAAMVVAIELNLKGLAEDAQGVVVGVEGAVDDRSDHALGVVVHEVKAAKRGPVQFGPKQRASSKN